MTANEGIDAGLYVSYLSHNRSLDTLYTSSADGISWPYGGVGLNGVLGTCITKFGQQLWIAVPDTDNLNKGTNLFTSADGTNWIHVGQSHRAVVDTPALASIHGRLYLAYRNSQNEIVQVEIGDLPRSWGEERVIAYNVSSLSMAAIPGLLVVAYIDAPGDLYILTSSDGTSWSASRNYTQVFGSVSPDPIVRIRISTIDKNTLGVVAGNTTGGMYTSTMTISEQGIEDEGGAPSITFAPFVGQGALSQSAPSIAWFRNKNWLSFNSRNSAQSLMIYSYGAGAGPTQSVCGSQASNGDSSIIGIEYRSGSVMPKVLVLTLMYAPPGAGGDTASTVTYGSQSAAGTDHSISSSLSVGVSGSISAGAPVGDKISADWSASVTVGESRSVSINKVAGNSMTLPGRTQSTGIDHDLDEFVLWVNPRLLATVDTLGNVHWTPDPFTEPGSGNALVTLFSMNVRSLKRSIEIYDLIAENGGRGGDALQHEMGEINPHHLTKAECQAILALNPLLETDEPKFPRFIPAAPSGIGYSTDQTSIQKDNMSISVTEAQSRSLTEKVSYSVKASMTEDFLTETLGVDVSVENSLSRRVMSEQTQAAKYTIYPPSEDRIGQEELYVYWDTIYSTFAFSFFPPPQSG